MIPINAISMTIFSLILLALAATSYATYQFFLEHRKFQEPDRLRAKAMANVNLDQRANDLYSYLAWHVEDCTQEQPLQQGEAMMLATYMVANAIHGMDRKDTNETLRQIAEMARDLKNQTRQPYRKDAPNVVEITAKQADAGDGAQIH